LLQNALSSAGNRHPSLERCRASVHHLISHFPRCLSLRSASRPSRCLIYPVHPITSPLLCVVCGISCFSGALFHPHPQASKRRTSHRSSFPPRTSNPRAQALKRHNPETLDCLRAPCPPFEASPRRVSVSMRVRAYTHGCCWEIHLQAADEPSNRPTDQPASPAFTALHTVGERTKCCLRSRW
jgi:hypothetical protein